MQCECECMSAKWIKWAMGNYIGGLKDASALIGSHFPSMKCFFFLLPLRSLSLYLTRNASKYLQKEIVSLLGKAPAVLDFGNALYLIHKMLLLMPFLLHCPSAAEWVCVCVCVAHLVMKHFDWNFRINWNGNAGFCSKILLCTSSCVEYRVVKSSRG